MCSLCCLMPVFSTWRRPLFPMCRLVVNWITAGVSSHIFVVLWKREREPFDLPLQTHHTGLADRVSWERWRNLSSLLITTNHCLSPFLLSLPDSFHTLDQQQPPPFTRCKSTHTHKKEPKQSRWLTHKAVHETGSTNLKENKRNKKKYTPLNTGRQKLFKKRT